MLLFNIYRLIIFMVYNIGCIILVRNIIYIYFRLKIIWCIVFGCLWYCLIYKVDDRFVLKL